MVGPEAETLTFTKEVARIMEVRRKYEEELMKKKNVVGLGVGLRERDGHYVGDKVVLTVLVRQKVDPDQLEPEDVIPRQLEDVEIDVVVVHDLRAQRR